MDAPRDIGMREDMYILMMLASQESMDVCRDFGTERGFERPYNIGIMKVNDSPYNIGIMRFYERL